MGTGVVEKLERPYAGRCVRRQDMYYDTGHARERGSLYLGGSGGGHKSATFQWAHVMKFLSAFSLVKWGLFATENLALSRRTGPRWRRYSH